METIRKWLEGDKNYDIGLTLLMKHSKNRILLQNLSRKQIPGKLEYELRKLCNNTASPVLPPEKNDPPAGPDMTINNGRTHPINPDTLPPHLKQLWEETSEKYRLSRALHEQIKQMPEAEQRAAALKQLEDYRQEIRANWDVIDIWTSEQDKDSNNGDIDANRINANRKYLSDGKKAVTALSGVIRAKKLEAMQRRINELLSAGEKFEAANQKELEGLGLKFNG